jgi:hypothetical protein
MFRLTLIIKTKTKLPVAKTKYLNYYAVIPKKKLEKSTL